ncbi:MAG TPA: Zn-dependent alcohol dehydrogenase [Acidimicrobiales bacterium]|nr:Zn-dependent alcohol dehydrogenase [Acidimicrobiales bacterium]
MRAALLEGVGDVKVVDDVEIEKPHEGEVLVRVQHCGVCHSDLHFVDGSLPCPFPAILGHEAGGIVEAVGAGVTGLAEGDKVILSLRPPCGRCYFCVRGQFSICPQYADMMGVLPDGGTRLAHQGRTVSRAGVFLAAFAEQAVVPANGVVKVPDDTPLEVAAVIGCSVQTGVGAVLNTAKVEAGATVMIIGLGGIGISIAQGARIAGAARVFGVDPVVSRRQQAIDHFGVTDVIDPAAGDVAAAIMEATGGIGVDYAFDAVGSSSLVETCIQATRPGGTTVMVGVPKIDQFLNVHALMFAMSEKKLTGCFLGSSNPHREFPRLLDLWRADKLDLEAMVTARRPLEEIGDAFEDMKAGKGLRTVLTL